MRRTIRALLDSGSEVSFISAETVNRIKIRTRRPDTVAKHVNLADGTRIPITRVLTLPITVQRETIRHQFSVLPNLSSPMLIGIDLWAKLRITLPPPPPPREPTSNLTTLGVITVGSTAGRSEETQRLKAFLKAELPRFEQIQGPTDRVQHHIRLKPGPAIKQRYRLRNPAMQAVIDQEVRAMEKEGVIEPSTSA